MTVEAYEEISKKLCSSLQGKTIVVKYGGSITNDNIATDAFMDDIAVLRSAGAKVAIIHGGGPDINRMLNKMSLKGEFVKGLRVTDEATMEVVEMVLSGRVNKNLTSKLLGKGIDAVGISGRDGRLIEAGKLYLVEDNEKIDIGLVGEITAINGKLLNSLMDAGYVPVISPVAGDSEGNVYNINADYAAAAIGVSLNADSLVYLSDVEGLYGDFTDESSLMSVVYTAEIEKLIQEGKISGGMIPKMKCCTEAIEKGVKSVCLIGGQKPHALYKLFSGEAIGTIIKGGLNNV